MTNKEDFYKAFLRLYSAYTLSINAIINKDLVQDGKITQIEFDDILTNLTKENIHNIETKYFIYIVQAFKNYKDMENYYNIFIKMFEQSEILEANMQIKEKEQAVFPLKFANAVKMSNKEEYLIVLSVQEIRVLEKAGVIKIIEGMQRETETVTFGNSIVSHVKYNDNVARTIAKNIIEDKYYTTTLRWHLVTSDDIITDYKYYEKGQTLVINEGIIAEIDGQHRSTAILYALNQKTDIDLKFSILLTIGSPEIAQYIINQDEQRQPIDKEQLKVYQNNDSSQIVKNLVLRLQGTIWSFYTTKNERLKTGFISQPLLIDIIELVYGENINGKEKLSIIVKLTNFFKHIGIMFEEYVDNTEVFLIKKFAKYHDLFLMTAVILSILDEQQLMDLLDMSKFNDIMTRIFISGKNQIKINSKYSIIDNSTPQFYNITTTMSVLNDIFKIEKINYRFKYDKVLHRIVVQDNK